MSQSIAAHQLALTLVSHLMPAVESRSISAKLRPGEVPVNEDDTVEYDEEQDESDDIDENDWMVQESDLDDESDDELSEGADEVHTDEITLPDADSCRTALPCSMRRRMLDMHDGTRGCHGHGRLLCHLRPLLLGCRSNRDKDCFVYLMKNADPVLTRYPLSCWALLSPKPRFALNPAEPVPSYGPCVCTDRRTR